MTWVCWYDEILFDLAVWDRKVRGSVCKRILLSRNVCVLTKIIRGKFRSCGFGPNFCPVEVAQWPKASVQVAFSAVSLGVTLRAKTSLSVRLCSNIRLARVTVRTTNTELDIYLSEIPGAMRSMP